MRAGQAGAALGLGRLGRSSNCSSLFTTKGRARIELTSGLDWPSSWPAALLDLTPALVLSQRGRFQDTSRLRWHAWLRTGRGSAVANQTSNIEHRIL